ncbi:MAG: MaoC family dehydratase [Deltaproteobacteria bacterium]|nr:MaoC family dehydratase [Deltaproteobacteria bacterium]
MTEIFQKAFDEVEIGDEIGPLTYAPTIEDIQRYGTEVRMVDQRFLSEEIARQRGFQHAVVPGPLSATFLVRLLTTRFLGWRLQTLTISFRAPVRHGDTLTCVATITQKEEQGGTFRIHCDLVAENPTGDRCLVGTAVLCPRRPA